MLCGSYVGPHYMVPVCIPLNIVCFTTSMESVVIINIFCHKFNQFKFSHNTIKSWI